MSLRSFLVQIIILSILLLLSAFFSGSETAFFSLDSLEKDSLRRRTSGRTGRFVKILFSQPDEVLVTILTGNMFVNIFASSISEAVGSEIFQQSAEVLSIVTMTMILLIIGEMTPKNLAVRHSLRFSYFSARILPYIHLVFWPIARPLGIIRHAVLPAKLFHRGKDESRGEAVLSAIRMGYQSNTIDESELRLLERFFRFREKTAADVMIPRVDCRPVDSAATVDQLLAMIAAGEIDGGSSLLPLYKSDVDHIAGYIRRSDLIPYRLDGLTHQHLFELERPIHAVPEGKGLQELMDEMSEMHAEMAVVVDEYGGTEGLVSFPTVMDYLFGDFMAVHDQPIHLVEEGTHRIAGGTELGEVEAVLRAEFQSESRTIGGLVIDVLGDLPKVGSSVVVSGYRFTVESVSRRRIAWLLADKVTTQ
ncbi:MAG: HlyC/CorC family transporter [Spirochaetales bacterium]|nr:MAG: HlyC/CorC family transporter [Spirochaetales bacterium]